MLHHQLAVWDLSSRDDRRSGACVTPNGSSHHHGRWPMPGLIQRVRRIREILSQDCPTAPYSPAAWTLLAWLHVARSAAFLSLPAYSQSPTCRTAGGTRIAWCLTPPAPRDRATCRSLRLPAGDASACVATNAPQVVRGLFSSYHRAQHLAGRSALLLRAGAGIPEWAGSCSTLPFGPLQHTPDRGGVRHNPTAALGGRAAPFRCIRPCGWVCAGGPRTRARQNTRQGSSNRSRSEPDRCRIAHRPRRKRKSRRRD